jgi:hypothetical protein
MTNILAYCDKKFYYGREKLHGTGHRDKTRVQMPAKMFLHLKLLCWLFMGPTLGLAESKETVS